MSSAELKLDIIKTISAIEDDSLLEEIRQFVHLEQDLDTVVALSTQEKQAIEVGLRDVKAGRVYSSEEADKKLREWLKK